MAARSSKKISLDACRRLAQWWEQLDEFNAAAAHELANIVLIAQGAVDLHLIEEGKSSSPSPLEGRERG